MLTFLIIAALGALAYITATQIMKSSKTEKSIDLQEVLMSKEDMHAEIAKAADQIKAQDPVVVESPFVAELVSTPKPRRKTTKKSTNTPKKQKATPKKLPE